MTAKLTRFSGNRHRLRPRPPRPFARRFFANGFFPPEFREHVGKEACVGADSTEKSPVDIEGLAVSGGRLYFGFRSPAKDRTAHVLGVDANALFGSGALEPAVATIEVGEGRGVRDLQAVKDGFLLLVRPDDDTENEGRDWAVVLWDGKTASVSPKKLARLDLTTVKLRECDKEIKPEALTVLEDEPDHYRILILSDGPVRRRPARISEFHAETSADAAFCPRRRPV